MTRVHTWHLDDMVEGQSCILKARIVTDAGTRISSLGGGSSVAATAVDVQVYDVTGNPPHALQNATTAVAVATAFTSDATGYLTWPYDGTGYNFLVVIPAGTGALFTVDWIGGHTYKLEVKVTTAATIEPGAQLEGPVSFIATVFVEPAYGQT